jgi:hypothetical protein
MTYFKKGYLLKITVTQKLCTESKNNQYPIDFLKRGLYRIGISPEMTQICYINYAILAAGSGLRRIQPNIIKEDYTRTAGL